METAIVNEVEKEAIGLREDVHEAIARQVLAQLGKPKNLFRVDVKPLFHNQFRVNVMATVGRGFRLDIIRIIDSFFITVTGDGLVSDPPIERKYP